VATGRSGSWPDGLSVPVAPPDDGTAIRKLIEGTEMSNETCRWVTARPLLFNDPGRGEVVSLPAGEPCSLLDSVEDARRRGLLTDEAAVWAAKTNLQRGYCLVWMRGLVRGVAAEDIVPRRG